jgi:hypothetical protein
MTPASRPPGRDTTVARPPNRATYPSVPPRRDHSRTAPPFPSVACLTDNGPDPERQLAAWASAVTHLHALGLPAPAPEFAAAWLRRRGIRPDWTIAS